MKCLNCQTVIPDEAKFCPYCGYSNDSNFIQNLENEKPQPQVHHVYLKLSIGTILLGIFLVLFFDLPIPMPTWIFQQNYIIERVKEINFPEIDGETSIGQILNQNYIIYEYPQWDSYKLSSGEIVVRVNLRIKNSDEIKSFEFLTSVKGQLVYADLFKYSEFIDKKWNSYNANIAFLELKKLSRFGLNKSEENALRLLRGEYFEVK